MALKAERQIAVEGIFEVEVLGLDEAIARLEAYDRISSEELERAMNESVKAIAATAAERAPKWSGNLANSMTSRVFSTASYIIGEVYSSASNPIYPLVMEYGRRAGAKPPPVEAIRPWVADKLGDESLAFVMARSIGRKGIKPHYFLKRSYQLTQSAVLGVFRLTLERIAQRLAG